MKKPRLHLTETPELITPQVNITSPSTRPNKASHLKYLITVTLTAILTILTLGCSIETDSPTTKTPITGNINYQNIQVDYGDEASRTAQLTNITPSNAINSDYLYKATPALPNGVTLNLTNGTITVATNAPGFSNTYTITATVTENDPQYQGSVTGSISINVEKTQITGNISYQNIQVDYGDEASRTAQLTNMTPSDATNSDYSYRVDPPLPNRVTLNLTNGTITVANNVPSSSNTYTITATVTENDPQYQGSVTGTISISIKANHFSTRRLHSVVEFKGGLYLIGGVGQNNSPNNDVWKSSDGTTWTEITTTTPNSHFSARAGHSVVKFNDELYLIGGEEQNNNPNNDVWKSSDGTTWTEVISTTPNTHFSARKFHSVVELNNELYLIGGEEQNNNPNNDVWKSSDGATWTEVISTTPNTHFSARNSHSVVKFNNELYLIGGSDGITYTNDVWKSSNGITWTEVTTTQAKFTGRIFHSVVEFKGELYLIGGAGRNSNFNSDVWKSSDGTTWTEVTTTQAKFTGRAGHSVVKFNDELYLIGGYGDGTFYNDVWKSSNGIDWEQKL